MAQHHFRPLLCRAPRAHLFSTTRFATGTQSFSTTSAIFEKPQFPQENQSRDSFLRASPAPPRLPKEEQEIFEALQRQSTGAFSTPRAPPQINQSPASSSTENREAQDAVNARIDRIGEDGDQKAFKDEFQRVIEVRGKGEELHPNVRRGATPEFEGETNPKTGEVGGPKNEPLRWGSAGEWSYNGRTTDF